MPLSQWLITTNYYEGGYFRPDPLVSLSSSSWLSDSLHLNFSLLLYFPPFLPSHLCRLVCPPRRPSSLPSLVWLIAVQINKASRFVVLLCCVTQDGGCFHRNTVNWARLQSHTFSNCFLHLLIESIHCRHAKVSDLYRVEPTTAWPAEELERETKPWRRSGVQKPHLNIVNAAHDEARKHPSWSSGLRPQTWCENVAVATVAAHLTRLVHSHPSVVYSPST